MSKVKWLNRTLLIGPYITLCTSEAEYKTALKRLKYRGDDGDWITSNGAARCHTFTQDDTDTCCVVCVALADHSPASIAAVLTHEAVHVWQGLRREIGEDSPGDEQEAYAVQNIAYVLIEEAFDKMGVVAPPMEEKG